MAGPHPVEVRAIQLRSFLLCNTRRHRDPAPAQGSNPSSFDHGIGVSHRHHHLSHARLYDCRYARWGSFEEVATGFERDVKNRATGAWSRLLERKNFCVRLSWTVVTPAAHDSAILDHEGADHGIWTGLAPALRRETERQGHEVEMRCGGSHRFLRVTRDRLRGRGTDFVFVVFIVAFFAFARNPDTLRVGRERLAPASAKAPWAAASRAMGTR